MALPQNPPTFTKVGTGSKEYSLELNDANFETKAWRLPRYEGSKTITSELNKYSSGDVTYGKTAATQKYTRNIYIGNAVIGMDQNASEDTNLMNIPAFSYATTIRYITINDDDTISDNKIETTKTNFDNKRGFYRAFYEDFPMGSDCRVVVNDESTKTNLKDRYNVYFNGGQLQKLISFNSPSIVENTFDSSSQYGVQQIGTKFGALVNFYNKNEITKFYTGSLDAIEGISANLTLTEFNSYINPFFSNYKNTSDYIGDKRMFLSFCTQSGTPSTPSDGDEFEPIRTIVKNNVPVGELYRTENLAEISTTEVKSINLSGTINPLLTFNITYLFTLNQVYDPGSVGSSNPFTAGRDAQPIAFKRGTHMITKCEDATPSLLLNLPKNEHLPDGVGGKSFVIIPENLHPHIKRNITHYLAKAGISLGVDTIPALDNTYAKLK